MPITIADFNNLAEDQLGVPYVWGGTGLFGSPHPGLDCSGLIFEVCVELGIAVPRTSQAQFNGLNFVSVIELRRGDLVFYYVITDKGEQPAHVAIWWDGLTVLEAPHTGEDVKYSPRLPYPIMGYRRLPFVNPPVVPTPAPPTTGDGMFGELSISKQDNFNATVRHLWNTYRIDPMTAESQALLWYTYNLPVADGGFGGSFDPLLANLVDGATKDGKIRPSLAGSV